MGAGIYVGLVFIEKTNYFSVRQYGWHGFLSIIPYLLIGILETDLLITMLKRYNPRVILKLKIKSKRLYYSWEQSLQNPKSW